MVHCQPIDKFTIRLAVDLVSCFKVVGTQPLLLRALKGVGDHAERIVVPAGC